MIRRASDEIRKFEAQERRRRKLHAAERQHIEQVDQWMHTIEELLEADQATVPEDLFRDIAIFIRQRAPTLYRNLRDDVHERNAVQVLDVLFDVQEVVKRVRRPASQGE